jgi:hypothetical protein
MAKKTKKRSKNISRRGLQKKLLPLLIVVSAGVVILTVLAIIAMPIVNPGSQRGVGANGFQAFVEKNTTLHVDSVVDKSDVVKELGSKAKSVSDVDTTAVFNLNGSRTQTATYNFVRTDDVNASIYVDLMFFKNQASVDDANVTAGTMDAGKIQGLPAYYLRAVTLGSGREYRLMVVKGLKVYKFVMVQPVRNVTISEAAALATLKKLATNADFASQ